MLKPARLALVGSEFSLFCFRVKILNEHGWTKMKFVNCRIALLTFVALAACAEKDDSGQEKNSKLVNAKSEAIWEKWTIENLNLKRVSDFYCNVMFDYKRCIEKSDIYQAHSSNPASSYLLEYFESKDLSRADTVREAREL